MHVLVPGPEWLERIRDAVPDARIDVFDGAEELPGALTGADFYVLPFPLTPPALAALARLPGLRVAQAMSAGVDAVRPLVPAGAVLCNARGVYDAGTAELALTLTLASLRRVPEFVRAQDAAEWRQQTAAGLTDRTVLIVGYGSIGAAIEARLAPFEPERILRVARTARDGVAGMDELPRLLPEADVVVLIVPLTDETRGMVDAAFLSRMRRGALLVNMARGPVVRTDDLVAALHDGQVHAALDVTDPEPLPAGAPLWSAPNVLISPHVGGATPAYVPRLTTLLYEQLRRHAAGEPLLNVISGAY